MDYMKTSTAILVLATLSGCASEPNRPYAAQWSSIDYQTAESGQSIKVIYQDIRSEVIERLMRDFENQRSQYPELWAAARDKKNSVAAYYFCRLECSYTVSISVPCSDTTSVVFTPNGNYPDIFLQFKEVNKGMTECCTVLEKSANNEGG
jgi:hypothetical protein